MLEKTYFLLFKHKPLLSSSFFCVLKGGVNVPQDQSSLLRFSVEESVWFQKGQEVEELLSISLEPDIAIREHDQYVSIKGALQLAGEYKMGEEKQEATDRESYPYSGARYVQDIETREDGVTELAHHFPVDITIPRNRVTNLEDVYVTVESFDYEFPEEGCLKLVADITILGIRGEEAYEQVVDEVEEQYEEELEESFEPMYRSEETAQEEYDTDPSQDLSDIFLANDEEEENEEYSTYTVEAKQQQEEEEREPSHQYEKKENVNVSAEHTEQKEERKNDNSLYLTKLFTREDEEEFSKLKMCIVQQGETVEEICKRYDITVQQLVRINHLDPDPTVYDGQILYIPIYVNH